MGFLEDRPGIKIRRFKGEGAKIRSVHQEY